jgi:transcriptional regulator with XRE-family HTH domain
MPKTRFQQNELTKRWIESYRYLSETKGLSQLKLQKDIGMKQSFASQILNNRVNFPAKYLARYCKAYRIDINSISTTGRFSITGNNRTFNGTHLQDLKKALMKNGAAVDIAVATRMINSVESKLSALQEEVLAIQKALGLNPSKRKGRK